MHLSPASMISHLLESIITGIRAMSGSEAIKFKNLTMAFFPSNIPSSMFTSKICAPPSTWSRATSRASSNRSSFINRKNLREPVTLVLSPMFTKLVSGVTINGSSPLSFRVYFFIFFFTNFL